MVNRQSEIQKKYDDKNTKRYGFKLNLNTDADIIQRLDTVENKQKYIKDLIRKDLKKA